MLNIAMALARGAADHCVLGGAVWRVVLLFGYSYRHSYAIALCWQRQWRRMLQVQL